MKSRINVAYLAVAGLVLMTSSLAFGQTADPGVIPTEPAAAAEPAPEATEMITAEPVVAETADIAADAAETEMAPADTTTSTAEMAPVDEMAAPVDPAAEAIAPMEDVAVESGVDTMVTDEADAGATALEGEAGVLEGTPEESSAQVIELTPEEESVPGAEIVADPSDENKISVTLDNVPLQDVIRMFTRISGANIVSGTNLVGNVTVNLQDVEWEPALKVILDVADMALVEKTAGIYAVIPKADLASEPVVSETIFLSFSTVSNILPVVQKLLVSTNASVAGFPAANALVVQETRPRLNFIKEAVAMIDRARHQVLIEAKFVELNDQAIKDLGINWQVLQGYNVGIRSPFYSFEKTKVDREGYTTETTERNNVVDSTGNINANLEGQSSSRSSLDTSAGGASSSSSSSSSFDSTPPDAPSLSESSSSSSSSSASRDSLDQNGSDAFSSSGNSTINVGGRNFTQIDGEEGTIEFFPVWDKTKETFDDVENTAISALGAILNAEDFELTLSALKQNSGVEIVSNPKVIVASGEKAQIHVGIRQPNYETKVEPGAGNQVIQTRQLSSAQPFIETGVIVDVEPTVNTESNITVKIVPELSRLLTSAQTLAGDIPPIQTRRIVSQFNLESGRTVAIGGLTQTEDRERVTKVPFLGDIPIIGKYLFSHTHTEKAQDEVIIFVTVAIANPHSLVQSSGIPEDGKLVYRHLARRVEENAREAEESKSSKKKKKPDWMSSKR
jgi:type II secretory pathway component GspD/PulD (secretin)